MAATDPGEVFMHHIAALPIIRPESTKNDDVPDIEDFEDDASQFTTASINSVSEGNVCDHRGTQAERGPKEDNGISLKLLACHTRNIQLKLDRFALVEQERLP